MINILMIILGAPAFILGYLLRFVWMGFRDGGELAERQFQREIQREIDKDLK